MARPKFEMKKVREDNGNSRVYYKPVKGKGLYCTQPNYLGETKWYKCSKDGEPSHIVPYHNFVITEE